MLSFVDNKFVSVPVNITTINELCDEIIQTPDELDKWLATNQIKYDVIENSVVGDVMPQVGERFEEFKELLMLELR